MVQPVGEIGRQPVPLEPPLPVALRHPRVVHTVLAAQCQHVLHGHHRQPAHGTQGGSDQWPGHGLAGPSQVVVHHRPGGRVEPLVPAQGGVVVVGAGIDHHQGLMVVAQVGVVRPPAEGELQHLHPRQPERLPQRDHLGGDGAEILGHQRQPPQAGFQDTEQLRPGGRHPAPADGGRVRGRDLPAGLETPEVIHPDEVEQRLLHLEAAHPPVEPGLGHPLPAIQGVAPALAGGGEIVRRHAGHHLQPALGIQPEKVRVGPDIGTVVGDEDGQVAEQQHVPFACILVQSPPLLEEQELPEAHRLQGPGPPFPNLGQGRGMAVAQRYRPVDPGALPLLRPQHLVEGIVLQPVGLGAAEITEGLARGRGGMTFEQVQQDLGLGRTGIGTGAEPAPIEGRPRIQQGRIAGIDRGALVG